MSETDKPAEKPAKEKYKRFKSQANHDRGSEANIVRAGKADKLLCKLAFLNGETDKRKLGQIGGCCEETLTESWIPEFELEKKKLFLSFRNVSLNLAVTDKDLEEHLSHVASLRQIASSYETDINSHKEARTILEGILTQLRVNDGFEEKEWTSIKSMLETWVTSQKSYDQAVTQYLKVKNELFKANGIEAHHAAASGRIKEAERLRGKDDAGRDPLLPAREAEEKLSADPFFRT